VRAYFAKWSSEWPHDAALRNVVAAFDARLKRLGKKEPAAGSISNRARDIADELDLPVTHLCWSFSQRLRPFSTLTVTVQNRHMP
jgi:hypothetical protein